MMTEAEIRRDLTTYRKDLLYYREARKYDLAHNAQLRICELKRILGDKGWGVLE